MSDINLDEARKEVHNLITSFQGRRAASKRSIRNLTRGKLYELFVLAWLLNELRNRGFHISLIGKVLSLKQAPGAIQTTDTYFELFHPASKSKFRLYTDIEVKTLGSYFGTSADLSGYHEIDIVVVDEIATGRPSPLELALGIECKSNAQFRKSILKEVLGIKRETGFVHPPQRSTLAEAAGQPTPEVPSDPPSEYIVCYVDPDGDHYSKSPETFGIKFKFLKP